MLAFLKRLFGFGETSAAIAPRRRATASSSSNASSARAADHDSIPAALPAARAEPALDAPSCNSDLLSMIDGRDHFNATLTGREEAILAAVSRRVETGDLVLPVLAATSMSAMEMTSKNSASVADIVELIAHDAVLSSEMLRVSNSALYAGAQPCTTLREAVVRIGMRATRSMIMSVSMRTMLLRDKELSTIALEVWRQSQSAAQIARAIAPSLGMDPERAFLIGLLHDIGKVALLETVRREVRDKLDVRPCLLGRVFFLQHERAGQRIAAAWKLPDELVSVAGCHHHYERNPDHPRSAALARLAHTLDLVLSIGGTGESARLEKLPEFDFLEVPVEKRQEILELVCETFLSARETAST